MLSALEGLREDPFAGKKLQGELYGLYSLRVWPYRIIYSIEKRIIKVTVRLRASRHSQLAARRLQVVMAVAVAGRERKSL